MSETDRILAKCIPGGTSCDPQKLADDLRVEISEMEARLTVAREALERVTIWSTENSVISVSKQALTDTAPKP